MCKSKSIVLSIVDCTGIVCFAIVTVNRQSPSPACQMPRFRLLYAFQMQAAVLQRFTLSSYMHGFLPHKDTLLSAVICLRNVISSSFRGLHFLHTCMDSFLTKRPYFDLLYAFQMQAVVHLEVLYVHRFLHQKDTLGQFI